MKTSPVLGYEGTRTLGACSEASFLEGPGHGIATAGMCVLGGSLLRNECISRRRLLFGGAGIGGLLFLGSRARADFNPAFIPKPGDPAKFLLSWDSATPGKILEVERCTDFTDWSRRGYRIRTRLYGQRMQIEIPRTAPREFFRIRETGSYRYRNAWMPVANTTNAWVPYNSKTGFFYDGRNDDREWVCGGAHTGYVVDSDGFHIVGGAYAGPPLVDPDGSLVIGGAYSGDFVTQPDGSFHLSGHFAGSKVNPDGIEILGGRHTGFVTHPDGTKSVGGAYTSFQQNPGGFFVAGGAYNFYQFNPDLSHAVGGTYIGSRLNPDGRRILGGGYITVLTAPDGAKLAGAKYDSWQRGTDGKVAAGGLYTGVQQNL